MLWIVTSCLKAKDTTGAGWKTSRLRGPGKAAAQGWLEPGMAFHVNDIEMLEKLERVKVSPGDVILLYTGRWKRRAALGPWPNATGFAGYHADVAYFLKERGVSFIGCDGPNDVSPTGPRPLTTRPVQIFALDLESGGMSAEPSRVW
jgi:kynurenine formamidase